MAQTTTSYDVNSGDDTALAVAVDETQTTGIILAPINRNGVDEAWETLTGCVVEVTEEVEGTKLVEYWGIGNGTVNTDLSVTLTSGDITRNIARDGSTLSGTGTGQKFNVGARVRLVNFHYNFNQKLNTDRDDGMASGKKLWFASIANYLRAVGNDLFFKDGNNTEHSLTEMFALAGTDEKIRISIGDDTANFLEEKLTGGDGIVLSVTNDEGDEDLDIDIDLDTDPGLEFNSGKLRVKVGAGLTRDSSGINSSAVTPTGMMALWVTDSAPTSWLLCYGQKVSLTTYVALYNVIGVVFGAVGSIAGGVAAATFTADAGTNFLTATAHGLVNNDVVVLTTSGTLPAGVTVATKYYVVNKTDNTFQLSLTSGGTAIDLTDTGSGTHTFNPGFTLPDMRGRFALGQDDMGGSGANRVTHANADTIGAAEGVESIDFGHTHSLTLTNQSANSGGIGEVREANTGAVNGGLTRTIMNPYITLNYIIKT